MSEVKAADLSDREPYWCFISYRHADNREQDREWASWLHTEIERYDVPPDLVGKKLEDDRVIPPRIYPVFRDEESASADADLTSSIINALDRSRSLVVLCSPRAVESRYVSQEIQHFRATGKSARIVPAIIAGEPNDPERECFPEALCPVLEASTSQDGNSKKEPLAADFRVKDDRFPYDGFTSAKAYRLRLRQQGALSRREVKRRTKAYEHQLQLMKLKVIGGILGVTLEQLRDRDRAYRLWLARRRMLRLAGAVLAVAVLGVLAVRFGLAARREGEASRARAHRSEAIRLAGSGQSGRALAWLAASLRLNPRDHLTVSRAVTLLGERTFAIPLTDSLPFIPMGLDRRVREEEVDALSSDGSMAAKDLYPYGRAGFGIFAGVGSPTDTTFLSYPFENPYGTDWGAQFDDMGDWLAVRATNRSGTEAGIWDVRSDGAPVPVVEPFRMAEAVGGGMRLDAGGRPRTVRTLRLQAETESQARVSWNVADGLYRPVWTAYPAQGQTGLQVRTLEQVAAMVPQGWKLEEAGEFRYILFNREGASFHLAHAGNSNVFALDASKGGAVVATGGEDNFARIWRVAGDTVSPGATMLHPEHVGLVRLSGDGTLLLTGTGDASDMIIATLRLWDARTGELLGGPWSTPGLAWACEISDDNAVAECAVSPDDSAKPFQGAAWPIGGSGSPEEALALADLLEAVGGWKVTGEGALESVLMPARLEAIARVRGLAQAGDASPLMRFVNWFLADRLNRGSPVDAPRP